MIGGLEHSLQTPPGSACASGLYQFTRQSSDGKGDGKDDVTSFLSRKYVAWTNVSAAQEDVLWLARTPAERKLKTK
jgi:hypothetical protein